MENYGNRIYSGRLQRFGLLHDLDGLLSKILSEQNLGLEQAEDSLCLRGPDWELKGDAGQKRFSRFEPRLGRGDFTFFQVEESLD